MLTGRGWGVTVNRINLRLRLDFVFRGDPTTGRYGNPKREECPRCQAKVPHFHPQRDLVKQGDLSHIDPGRRCC